MTHKYENFMQKRRAMNRVTWIPQDIPLCLHFLMKFSLLSKLFVLLADKFSNEVFINQLTMFLILPGIYCLLLA